MAGPAVERIWQDYRARPFRLLAIDFWNGNPVQVQSFITATRVTFPVLRNGGQLQAPSQYGISYDNYVLVDTQGIVRYTSVGEVFGQLGRFHDGHLRSAILTYLPLPVSGKTWSAVKSLFRD